MDMEPTQSGSHIYIVIVLYNPTNNEIQNVRRLSQEYNGIIVDNSLSRHIQADSLNMMEYVWSGSNLGIAAAHNIGIRRALENADVRYVMFLDQDSDVSLDYPKVMIREYELVKASGINVGALGAMVVQKETGEVYRSVIHKERRLNDCFISKPEIIASGCCVDKDVFRIVGLNDENFFIDFVDSEWCFRARSYGYDSGITPNVLLQHKVGRRELHISSHIIVISSPQRYYYQYRNLIKMLPLKYVPMKWKLCKLTKFALRFFYFPLFIVDGVKCWKHMSRGLIDGLKEIW